MKTHMPATRWVPPAERAGLGLLCLWLLWLPLPFGSNIPRARLPLILVPLLLCAIAAAIRLYATRDRTNAVQPTRPWLIWGNGALLFLAVTALQLVPLPPAMLAIVYAMSLGHPEPIVFDEKQQVELLLTLGQAVVGMLFLMNMKLTWWEASVMLAFFAIPFIDSDWAKPVAGLYFAWAGVTLIRMLASRRKPPAFHHFGHVWRTFIRRRS